jgi:hypothetical protein
MTTEHHASRTLVKSPPELWAECSDAASLARHIGEFGEIRITRLDPETSIDWEGELATGTVTIEPSAWGTRVTLTIQTAAEKVAEAEALAERGTARADEPEVLTQDAGEVPAEPPIIETEPVKEDVDEEMEAPSAEPDPALAADPGAYGGRWKRLIQRTRSWFKPREDDPEPEVENVLESAPESGAVPPPEPHARAPLEADLVESPPPPPPAADPEPTVEPDPSLDPDAILTAALDSLGQAHHRPFSRA